MSYDVTIAYRIYPKVSKTPAVFADDKLRLAELCLSSLGRSLDGVRAKLIVLLDRCPPEYADLFRETFPERDLELVDLPGIGNAGTFQMQIDRLLDQRHSEHVYFAEDDYYYLPGVFGQMLDFMRAHGDADFVSPFDHLDLYTLSLHRGREEIRVHADRHWRTAQSTCLTFLTTKKSLAETREAWETYTRGNLDAAIWMSITKRKVLDPLAIARLAITEPATRAVPVRAWQHTWRQILFGRPMKLWVPMPAIGTHMENPGLAPGIEWYEEFSRHDPRKVATPPRRRLS